MLYDSGDVKHCPQLIKPGHVIIVSDPFHAFGVIFDRKAWCELTGREFDQAELDMVASNEEVITIRILGERIANAKLGIQESLITSGEPCDKIFRHYLLINRSSQHYKLIASDEDFLEVVMFLRPFFNPSNYIQDVLREYKLLLDYMSGKALLRDELGYYYFRLLELFKKGIPIGT